MERLCFMPHQVLMLLSSSLILASSPFFQLINGHGHCLTSLHKSAPATAMCTNKSAEQLFKWDAESRLCNSNGECLFIRSPWSAIYPISFWPPLSVEGQLWHRTPWGNVVDAKGQCLNSNPIASNQTSEAFVDAVACDKNSRGQLWSRIYV